MLVGKKSRHLLRSRKARALDGWVLIKFSPLYEQDKFLLFIEREVIVPRTVKAGGFDGVWQVFFVSPPIIFPHRLRPPTRRSYA